jgi:hypothetical protein
MLCFITALKSKVVSKNWETVSALFENSLRSAYEQIDPDFKIIVVCHEIPHLTLDYDDRIEFITVDFPPPEKLVTELTMQDKWKKLAIGMVRAGELKPDFIMFLDADDLVSNRLSQYVNQHKTANGWMLKHGYTYQFRSNWVDFNDCFHCGSDSIVSSKLINFPQDLSEQSIRNCIVLRWGHTIIGEKLAEQGTPLEPLPFLGAMQVVNYGDNDSSLYTSQQTWYGLRHFLGKVRRTRRLGPRLKHEFSMLS